MKTKELKKMLTLALMKATLEKDFDKIPELVALGADPSVVRSDTLEDVVKKKRFDVAECLLSRMSDLQDIDRTFLGKDPEFSATWTHNLFSYSCCYGNLDFCKFLVSKGADPIGKDSSILEGFPLVISVLHNQFHISDWLQKEFNIDCSINDSWPLKISAEYGNFDGVKYALAHGADMHAGVDEALRLAATNGHLEIAKYLILEGADYSKVEADTIASILPDPDEAIEKARKILTTKATKRTKL